MRYGIRIRQIGWAAARGAAVAAALAVCAGPAGASPTPFVSGQQTPAPIERRAPSPVPETSEDHVSAQPRAAARTGSRGEHLAEWMSQHSNLSPQQQQQALQREPGFREQPTQTQQRMLQRLAQLDAMTPDQRQRALARTEAMERLNPDQRAQVRSAMSQLGNLAPDQRHVVARTFRALRELPAEQRVSAYTSGRYGQLNDVQRAVLFDLLRVEPLLTPLPAQAQPQPPMALPPQSQTFR